MSDFNFDDFDLGGLSDEAAYGFDPSVLENVDLSSLGDFDFRDFDLGGLSDEAAFGFDPSILGGDEFDAILANLGGGGDGYEGVDFRDFNLNEMSDEAAFGFDPSILGGGGDLPRDAIWDPELEGEISRVPFGESSPDYKQPSEEVRAAEKARYEKFLADQEAGNDPAGKTADVEKQDYGASTDVDKSLSDMADRGSKLPSGWQKSSDGSYVNIRDDGTADGIDQDGNSFALSESQVQARIKSGDLNTFKSGYYTATGGDKYAPGGGRPVTLKNGQVGTLKPGGKVIDNNTGKTIGTDKDVKDGKDGKGGTDGKGGGAGSGSKDNSLSSLLPLLLMMMMMNKDKGGGGSSTVIPGLTATQRQTPYTQQQRAPGYRPGQGGITYFDQTQYAPKMAAGGGISRLLRGPGDGVSDSIPAVITNGMSRGGQPAKVARGEYIIDARTVAALGNGSTDAGAERLDKMRKNILRDDRKAGVGKDSKAYRHLLA